MRRWTSLNEHALGTIGEGIPGGGGGGGGGGDDGGGGGGGGGVSSSRLRRMRVVALPPSPGPLSDDTAGSLVEFAT